MSGFSINSYFLNKKVFQSIVDSQDLQRIELAQEKLPFNPNQLELKYVELAYMRAAVDFIKRKEVPPLFQLLLTKKVEVGNLITFDGVVYFKNAKISEALNRVSFHIKLPQFDNIEIRGDFSKEHYTCNSALVRLSGRSRIFIFGYIENLSEEIVSIKPIIFGDRVLSNNEDLGYLSPNQLRVFPEDIEEFNLISKIKYEKAYNARAIEKLSQISELTIKQYITEIIFENNVPKDWGGEKSDFYTTHLHLKGVRIRAAFILKGPSRFHLMQVKDLGKNGDQIVRLFDESADLYILQHCHFVSPSVEKIMESFASRYMNIKKYMILDGVDTYRLFKSYNKI